MNNIETGRTYVITYKNNKNEVVNSKVKITKVKDGWIYGSRNGFIFGVERNIVTSMTLVHENSFGRFFNS